MLNNYISRIYLDSNGKRPKINVYNIVPIPQTSTFSLYFLFYNTSGALKYRVPISVNSDLNIEIFFEIEKSIIFTYPLIELYIILLIFKSL